MAAGRRPPRAADRRDRRPLGPPLRRRGGARRADLRARGPHGHRGRGRRAGRGPIPRAPGCRSRWRDVRRDDRDRRADRAGRGARGRVPGWPEPAAARSSRAAPTSIGPGRSTASTPCCGRATNPGRRRSSRPRGSCHVPTAPPTMMAAWTRCRPRRCSPAYPAPMRAIAQRLRQIVRRALPDAIEAVRPGWRLIGYDIPSGRKTAFCCFVWAEQEHVHLGFQYGVFMHDPDRVLEGEGITQRARWLTFEPGDPIDEARAPRADPRGGADHPTVTRRALRGPPRPSGPDSIGRVTDQPRRWPPAAGLLGAASFLLIGWSGLLDPVADPLREGRVRPVGRGDRRLLLPLRGRLRGRVARRRASDRARRPAHGAVARGRAPRRRAHRPGDLAHRGPSSCSRRCPRASGSGSSTAAGTGCSWTCSRPSAVGR